MTLEASIQGLRLRVMRRAQETGNVSQVCREFGISRALFYRWDRRFEAAPRAGQGRPVRVPPETERLVRSVALSAGTWGCSRIAGYLARTWQLRVAPSTVQRLLRRVGLATRAARLAVLAAVTAREPRLLRSRDGGATWEAPAVTVPPGSAVVALAVGPGEHVVLATSRSAILRLRDGGRTWQAVVGPGFGRLRVRACPLSRPCLAAPRQARRAAQTTR
jgi:transposase